MKQTLLLGALLAAAAHGQNDNTLPAMPITEAAGQDPTHGAIIPATDALPVDGGFPRLFKYEFHIKSGDEERISCGGDVLGEDYPDLAPYQSVRCTTTYPIDAKLAKKRPSDCDLDWIATFILPAKGKAEIRWECRGDSDFGHGQSTALKNGGSLKGKGWQCQRQGEALTCRNGTKHGFTIGSKTQKIF